MTALQVKAVLIKSYRQRDMVFVPHDIQEVIRDGIRRDAREMRAKVL